VAAAAPEFAALDTLRRANPEWGLWLEVLAETIRASREPRWTRHPVVPSDTSEPGAPALAGVAFIVDGSLARAWVDRVLGIAARGDGPASSLRALRSLDAFDILDAVLADEPARLDTMAQAAGADSRAFRAMAGPLAMPLLQAHGAAAAAPGSWRHGYCPTCGAWPALAETRGLEGTRYLRCLRCGGDWRTEWLCCPFCGENDHRRLGSLVPEDATATRKVDVCESCRGFVKSVTVLAARPRAEVPVLDLETVDLDLAALDHGFTRPEGVGYPLRARARERRGGLRGRLRWS
jgi:FdhE protein